MTDVDRSSAGRLMASTALLKNLETKVKWFLKVIKHANFCGKHIFNSLLPRFFQVHILQMFQEQRIKLVKMINFFNTFKLSTTLPSFRFLSVIA